MILYGMYLYVQYHIIIVPDFKIVNVRVLCALALVTGQYVSTISAMNRALHHTVVLRYHTRTVQLCSSATVCSGRPKKKKDASIPDSSNCTRARAGYDSTTVALQYTGVVLLYCT